MTFRRCGLNREPFPLPDIAHVHHLNHAAFSGFFNVITGTPPVQRSDFHRILSEWPVSIARKGIMITSYGESVPFTDFMLSGTLALVDRGAPDTTGARRVIIAIDSITVIKITDPIEMDRFTAMGFQANTAR